MNAECWYLRKMAGGSTYWIRPVYLFPDFKLSFMADLGSYNLYLLSLYHQDERLNKALKKMGQSEKPTVGGTTWSDVATAVGNGRDSMQCLRRYKKLLADPERHEEMSDLGVSLPGAVTGKWTAEEDSRLLDLVETFEGKNWSRIAVELPGKGFISFKFIVPL